jgi:hypothetical protein
MSCTYARFSATVAPRGAAHPEAANPATTNNNDNLPLVIFLAPFNLDP